MNMYKFSAFLYMSLLTCAFNVHADSATLNINGTVSTSCAFTGTSSGALAVSPSSPTVMGTYVNGGAPAVAQLSFTGTPTLTVTEITSFDSQPSGFNPTLTFSNSVQSSLLGNMPFSSGSASGQYTSGNTDTVTVNLGVQSSAPYVTGNYSASTTITCQ